MLMNDIYHVRTLICFLANECSVVFGENFIYYLPCQSHMKYRRNNRGKHIVCDIFWCLVSSVKCEWFLCVNVSLTSVGNCEER
jgi:hypothetical protein